MKFLKKYRIPLLYLLMLAVCAQTYQLRVNKVIVKESPWVDITAWGAKGDNSSDNSVAIQAALTAASGGTVVVPPGTYRFNSTLSVPGATTLKGGGRGLIGITNNAIFRYTGVGGTAIKFIGNGVAIKELRLEGDQGGGTGAVGVDVNGKVYWQILDSRITGFSTVGIKNSGGYLGSIERNHFENNGQHIVLTPPATCIRIIQDEFFETLSGYAIQMTDALSCTIDNCSFDNIIAAAFAIKISGTNTAEITVCRNYLESGNSKGFIQVDASAPTVFIYDNILSGPSTPNVPVMMDIGGSHTRIGKNHFYVCDIGIQLEANARYIWIEPQRFEPSVVTGISNGSAFPQDNVIFSTSGVMTLPVLELRGFATNTPTGLGNVGRMYVDTSGAKPKLMVIFQTGVAQQIAIEP